jgi:UDPglucose 6-dehydrogenase
MGARVRAFDPIAMDACREQYGHLKITYCDSAMSAAEDADAIVLVTEWPEFRDLDLGLVSKQMAQSILVDGRNLFDPAAARIAGFDYCGIGRSENLRGNGKRGAAPRVASV